MENIDIKALARQLKKVGQENYSPKVKSKENTPRKKVIVTKSKIAHFEDLISQVNERRDFNCIGGVYIDEDLYELLRQLKLRKKLKIGCFVSQLIEQFVNEHQDEIIACLHQKKNKYL